MLVFLYGYFINRLNISIFYLVSINIEDVLREENRGIPNQLNVKL